MKIMARVLAFVLFLSAPSIAFAQGVDFSSMNQWLMQSAHETTIPIGTKITMSNWQKYQQFMPFGMVQMFKGTMQWKMPQDIEMDVGPSHFGGNLPQTWMTATEKYGSQTNVQKLPDGHYQIVNYQGGTPFPNPEQPYKGQKILANVFFAYAPAVYVKTSSAWGTVWSVDRYGDIAPSTLAIVYRWTDYITDQGFPKQEPFAAGTWYTEWGMQLTPEQSRYTAQLALYYTNQQSNPYPASYVFVPALRRTLRLSTSARCSPVFGFDWTQDDAKFNGFNGSTSTYVGKFLGDRKILNLTDFDGQDSGNFPQDYYSIGFPRPDWGKWELRDTAIDDVTRIPSEAAGYCYAHRILYADRELWSSNWVDLYDSNNKLWKSIAYLNQIAPDLQTHGYQWRDIAESTAWDLQNKHATIWSSYGNPSRSGAYFDAKAPAEYLNGIRYGTPGGLMEIMR